MENDETKVDERLKSAFNDGYILGFHRPDIARSMERQRAKSMERDPTEVDILFKGIEEGIEVRERITELEQDLQSIQKLRDTNELKDKGNTNPDANYTYGFNAGYLLGKHAPDLAEQLTTELNGQGDYAMGFTEGHLACKQELLQKWLREVREIREWKGKDVDRNREP